MYELPSQYLDPKYWSRGKKNEAGAPSNGHIHIAVGHALSNWEHVEAAGLMLFSYFVETRSIAASRAYGSINGARAREAALRQACETFFTLRKNAYRKDRKIRAEIDTAEQCAKQLIHNYGQASGRRNDIAHGMAWELSLKEQADGSWFLVAPNHQSPKTANWIEDDIKLRSAKGLKLSDTKARFDYNKFYRKNTEYVFSMGDIKVFAGKFALLYAEMLSFGHALDPNQFATAPEKLFFLAKHLSG